MSILLGHQSIVLKKENIKTLSSVLQPNHLPGFHIPGKPADMLPHHLGKHHRRRVDHLLTGHRAEQALALGGHAVADKVLSAVVHPNFRPLEPGANAGFHRLRWFIGRQEFRLLLLSRFGRA